MGGGWGVGRVEDGAEGVFEGVDGRATGCEWKATAIVRRCMYVEGCMR